jgi:uncharacterized membrane-anchored protein
MTTWLRVALALQVLFFTAWGARLLTSHREASVVWLATEPVDPRDLLSGHFVALRYRIASAATALCERPEPEAGETPVYVRLAAVGDPVTTTEGPAVISEPVACQTSVPARSVDAIWIGGRLDPASGQIVYGIERMFVGEHDPLRAARSGTVVAKVAINDQFEPRLLALISKRTATDGPP